MRFALVLSIPGIGERTALALIVRMPELGQLSREEASALAGLAPFDDDSGKHKGSPTSLVAADGALALPADLPAAFRWNKALISCQLTAAESFTTRLRKKAPDLYQRSRPARDTVD